MFTSDHVSCEEALKAPDRNKDTHTENSLTLEESRAAAKNVCIQTSRLGSTVTLATETTHTHTHIHVYVRMHTRTAFQPHPRSSHLNVCNKLCKLSVINLNINLKDTITMETWLLVHQNAKEWSITIMYKHGEIKTVRNNMCLMASKVRFRGSGWASWSVLLL